MLNGSPRIHGNTDRALNIIGEQLAKEGIEYEIFQMGGAPVRDCIGCGMCRPNAGKCIFDDDKVNEFIEKAKTADGFIFGTPVYFAHPTGRILSLLDRAFYAGGEFFTFKPGASVTVARRAGTTASYDVMNKYFGIRQMPIIGSTYWNCIHGQAPGEVDGDPEGLQTLRNLARNMAWMLKNIEVGKQAGIPLPQSENSVRTNFIR